MKLRPELVRFAEAMERKLRTHDKDRQKDVSGFDSSFCMDRIGEEYDELKGAYERGVSAEVLDESVDVANFTMMLWNTTQRSLAMR